MYSRESKHGPLLAHFSNNVFFIIIIFFLNYLYFQTIISLSLFQSEGVGGLIMALCVCVRCDEDYRAIIK